MKNPKKYKLYGTETILDHILHDDEKIEYVQKLNSKSLVRMGNSYKGEKLSLGDKFNIFFLIFFMWAFPVLYFFWILSFFREDGQYSLISLFYNMDTYSLEDWSRHLQFLSFGTIYATLCIVGIIWFFQTQINYSNFKKFFRVFTKTIDLMVLTNKRALNLQSEKRKGQTTYQIDRFPKSEILHIAQSKRGADFFFRQGMISEGKKERVGFHNVPNSGEAWDEIKKLQLSFNPGFSFLIPWKTAKLQDKVSNAPPSEDPFTLTEEANPTLVELVNKGVFLMSDGTLKTITEFGEEQFSPEDLGKRRTIIHPDGSGDILFFIEKPIPYDLDPLFSWRGAKGIEDVISAENAIKSTLQNL